MKEMIYSTERKEEILDEGDYLDHHYVIMNLGCYPTAYVEIPEQLSDKERDSIMRIPFSREIKFYDGVTYDSYINSCLVRKKDNRQYIGWHYGSYGDWNEFYGCNYNLEHFNIKHKTDEIYKDIKNVIKRLIKIENKEMWLEDTIRLMTSEDYKDRFKAEYYQLKIRYEKLNAMVKNWDNLSFEPTCSKETFNTQLEIMLDYLKILEVRANIEDIELN